MSQLYPLKFTPIQQEKIWGGTLLNSVLHKQPVSNSVGESWEVSAIEGFVSVVSNGAMKGKSLQDILDEYPKELLGQKVYKKYNKTFPLLIKFIDAREDLSVQLHPDDVLAQQRHNSLGKEEMWYIVQADKDSKLYLGFNQELNKATLLEHIQNKTLPGVLHQQPVTAGDVFHITPGLVHSIGGGILLAEIQQSSDVTYRLYDWDRTDDQGKSRTLHIEESLDAIDYDYHKSPKIPYEIVQNRSKTLVDGDYFKTD
ncbi:MAG: mannose-6-phosphate isomerase, partial [Flavobacteriia bacterium]